MAVFILIATPALFFIFSAYSIFAYISFINAAKRVNLDLKQKKQFRRKMIVSGIGLSFSVSILLLNGKNFSSFILLTFFLSIIFSWLFAKIASNSMSKYQDDYK